jgi:hypothetical protein
MRSTPLHVISMFNAQCSTRRLVATTTIKRSAINVQFTRYNDDTSAIDVMVDPVIYVMICDTVFLEELPV